MHKKITLRIIGFILSLLFSLSAYVIIVHPEFFGFRLVATLSVIFVLALFQSAVQAIFFLDIWREKGPPWNLAIFISTLGVIITIVLGTLWIMSHLNYNMMMQ